MGLRIGTETPEERAAREARVASKKEENDGIFGLFRGSSMPDIGLFRSPSSAPKAAAAPAPAPKSSGGPPGWGGGAKAAAPPGWDKGPKVSGPPGWKESAQGTAPPGWKGSDLPGTTEALPKRRPGVKKTVVAGPTRTTKKTTVAGPTHTATFGMSKPKQAAAAPRNWRGADSTPAAGQKAIFSGKKSGGGGRSSGIHDFSRLKFFKGKDR